jgi:hypothetical protein
MSSVTNTINNPDSASETKQFFDRYFTKPISFTSNEVDSVVAFFTKRGFEKDSAVTIASILLQQAKVENKKIFTLLDTLEGLDEVKLNQLIAAILNNNRSKISILGYKRDSQVETAENRNVII